MSQLFINPIELLGLGAKPVAALDGATVRKARIRLRHELQLSDAGTIAYHGQQLDQSAIEMACADLDNPGRLQAWHRLAGLAELSEFLGTGRAEPLLTKQAQYARLTTDQDLLELIGARYAEQYDRALAAAFRAGDAPLLRLLAALPLLFKPTQQAQATRSIGRTLREATAVCEELAERLGENDNADRIVAGLRKAIAKAGRPATLAALPDLLGGPRTALVLAVRNYAIALFNTVDDSTAAALQLLREAATVPTDARTLDRVQEDIKDIEEIEQRRVNREQLDGWITQYNSMYEQLVAYKHLVALSFREADAHSIRRWTLELDKYVVGLNALDGEEVAEARDNLAWAIRGLAVDIWNKHQSLGSTAVLLVTAGLKIQASKEVEQKLREDRSTLKRLIRKRIFSQVPDRVWSWGIIALVVFVVVMCSKLTDSGSKSKISSI